MKHFHTFQITDLRRETADTVSVQLSPKDSSTPTEFTPGQYITFKFQVNGEELRRSYSLCSAPHENELRVAVKEVENGRVSGHINRNLRVGDFVECMPPEGNFTKESFLPETHYIFFAAGSGITPVASLIKAALAANSNQKITLFYGNRNEESIIFKDELEKLSEEFGNFNVHHILSGGADSALYSGRINFGKATELLYNFCQGSQPREFFICGPSGMMTSVKNALTDAGTENEFIHMEYFETPVSDSSAPEKVQAEEEDQPAFEGVAHVKVWLDDEDFEFDLATNGSTILNAALDEGEDAPYSCKGGVCTTCKAKIIHGSVKMDNDFALTEGEKAQGYILTCQSHPTSENLEISYDE